MRRTVHPDGTITVTFDPVCFGGFGQEPHPRAPVVDGKCTVCPLEWRRPTLPKHPAKMVKRTIHVETTDGRQWPIQVWERSHLQLVRDD